MNWVITLFGKLLQQGNGQLLCSHYDMAEMSLVCSINIGHEDNIPYTIYYFVYNSAGHPTHKIIQIL